ncbi:MAG: lasso peptide biosynthesis B2 protein [Desulfamplus sp.]|nr:lasso peptide biosynthesis B2 protein [Desulfamplus sp.]
MNAFRRFFTLNPDERWLSFQMVVMLMLTSLGLKLFGFKSVVTALNGFNWLIRHPVQDDIIPNILNHSRRLIRYAKRHGYGTCLSRSLVLWWILYHHGIDTDLRIGICKNADQFQAHAWIEYKNKPLNAGRRVRRRYIVFKHSFTPIHK